MFLPERDKALQVLRQSDCVSIWLGEEGAYRASRDCCRPVPTITTSQSVLSSVSMVGVRVKRLSVGQKFPRWSLVPSVND